MHRSTQQERMRGFTLIEILVVVAIIALLIAVLLPSLRLARENTRGAVCGSNMRQLTVAGTMWMHEGKNNKVPVHRGWAPFLLKNMKGEQGPFNCPSDIRALPLPAVFVRQFRQSSGEQYPTVSIDGAYFMRSPLPDASGDYTAKMETDVEKVGGGDRDFNDADIIYRPDSKMAKMGNLRAVKGSTGRTLVLDGWKGGTLGEITGSSTSFRAPMMWGSFGLNLSAALPGAKPHHVLYADYRDWVAVLEPQLGVKTPRNTNGTFGEGFEGSGDYRTDDPARTVAYRHNGRANVGFLDNHVESMHKARLTNPRLWFPQRPIGWSPPRY